MDKKFLTFGLILTGRTGVAFGYILDAAKAYATLGEICDVMREVFGEYEEPPTF